MSLSRRRRGLTDKTRQTDAFPTAPLLVLAVCRLCEPIAFLSIFPYIYHMVQSFNVTQNEDQITFYAGLITSAFAFAEAMSSMFWGRLSDRIGRKPVLLTGLAGTGLSMLIFGFSKNLALAITARCLGGLLNGNIGVIQTTVAEIVRVEAHQPRAYSVLPFIWGFGAIIGSGIGGTLADPVRHYPAYFARGGLFDEFPYLLPNLVCAAFALISFTVGFLFLEETHEAKIGRRDCGLLIGRWILSFGHTSSARLEESKSDRLEETLAFLADDQPPDYSSARTSSSDCSYDSEAAEVSCITGEPVFRSAFTKQVLLSFVAYGILAFHTICIETLLPMFYEMPRSDSVPMLPFKFTGGLGMSTKTVGLIISAQGFVAMLMQIFVYPVASRMLGSVALFRWTCLFYPALYAAVPYLAVLPEKLEALGIVLVMVSKVTLGAFLVPSIQIILVKSSPSKKVLGTVNGFGASVATVCRGFGPIVSGAVQDGGLKLGYVGAAWWFLTAIAVLGYLESLLLTGTCETERSRSTCGLLDKEVLVVEPFTDSPAPIASDHQQGTAADACSLRGTRDF